ncbi:jerky protein homolog-like [Centruroides sculpturatus]|uniref:jerky protein homolog-like n=1 Tax=Centruroides sculpturatus TaxID=218467 RepID=UPI000C6D2E07|nr:jerky protein homolog-like [Centruroides sculpturatus]
MASSVKRKQVNMSMEQKLRALKRLDKGESVSAVAKDLGVGKSTIRDWKKKRTEIESWCVSRMCTETLKERKSMKESDFNEVSEALYIWFRQTRKKGTPISGPILQEKALKFYEEFKKDNDPKFVASTGWLDRWKKRYGVRQLSICGEKLSGDIEGMSQFKKIFQKFIKAEGLTREQLYKCDETGLNYKLLPAKSLAFKEEQSAQGFKTSKERVTILACSNATGEHKLKLGLIGKSKKPCAFKHIEMGKLSVWYRNQSHAWMSCAIFKEWFHEVFVPSVEQFLKSKNLPRKAILILDNASLHPDIEELKNGDIRAMFLPPNVTALCQPMDQGVLVSLKRRYRHKLLSSLLSANDNDQGLILQNLKKINLLDVVGWVADAWNELESLILVRSWRKLLDHEGNEFIEHDDAENVNLLNLLKRVPGCAEANENDIEQWFQNDTDQNIMSNAEIIAAVTVNEKMLENNEDVDVEDSTVQAPKISHSEGLKAVETALQYFEQQGASVMDLLFLRRLRDEAAKRRVQCRRQQDITHFFKKK